jgi:hypothetical protein
MTENSATKPLELDAFLSGLPPEVAQELRVQAARIDELEGYALPVRGIEARLKTPFLVATAMFIAGLILFLSGGSFLGAVRDLLGRTGLTILLGALPGLAAYYAFRVRWRTKADKIAFDVNRDHFLPQGVIYFPPSEPGEKATIVPVDTEKAYKPTPSKYDKVKPGPLW